LKENVTEDACYAVAVENAGADAGTPVMFTRTDNGYFIEAEIDISVWEVNGKKL
jgi:hypothetical protein